MCISTGRYKDGRLLVINCGVNDDMGASDRLVRLTIGGVTGHWSYCASLEVLLSGTGAIASGTHKERVCIDTNIIDSFILPTISINFFKVLLFFLVWFVVQGIGR